MSGARLAIKVCGITSPEDAHAVAAAGVDAVGLVFWPASPRAVDAARAREIATALPPFVARVGVFVDAPPEQMAELADAVGLDVLQLHGDEPVGICDALPRRVVKALRVGAELDLDLARAWAERAAGVLLDARRPGTPGGTGRTFDWDLAERAAAGARYVVLAGGLDPDNVGEGIRAVQPHAVDVSSGVERSPGRKDPARVAAFVAAVRALQPEAVR